MRINKHDTQGTKPLLGKGELGYDDYTAGGDVGRVYVGTGGENIALAKKSEIDSHVSKVDNPHSVTKAQVGLGNVDNTSDVNKPISTATQTALNLKAPLVSPTLVTPNIGVATGTSFNSITGLSSTTPSAAGTAAIGTSTTVARADHVHPVQTSVSGNAGTATKLTTARTISLTGDVTGSVSFDGSADASISATIAANSVALGTDTTGNYVAGVTAGQGITISGTAGEGWSPTIALSALDLTLFPTSNFKKSVKVATTANITLSGVQTIDGISVVAGDRVLVKDQTTASQNGIYIVNASTWTRSTAADGANEIDSAVVGVDQGTTNGGRFFTNTFKTTDTVGTTAMPWYEVATTSSTVSSANTLATARTVQTNLGSTASASFNGSANITPGVTGTLPVSNGGTGATTLTGLVKGNGTSAMSAAVAGTDYVVPSGSITGNASTATTLQTARTISGVSFNGSANIDIEDRLGTAIASAATTTIGTRGLGDYIHITGTTTITSFGTAAAAGVRRTLIFDGALTLTHNATSLICPGATNIVTVAGTVIEVVAETTANWRVVSITHPSLSMDELGYLDGVTSAIQTQLNAKAALASPALTGTPTTPTAAVGTSTTQIASTAFVNAEIANDAVLKVTSTDNAIVRFNGTTGNVKNSSITIDDLGNLGNGTQTFNGFGGSGFKNYIINGGFDIDQRNNKVGILIPAGGYAFTADRWLVNNTTNQPVSITVLDFPTNSGGRTGRLRIKFDTAPTTGMVQIFQKIENVSILGGKVVTLSHSFAGDEMLITNDLTQNFGTGGSPNVITVFSNINTTGITTSLTRFSSSIAIPSIEGKTIGTNSYTQITYNLPIRTTNIQTIAQVQLEEGSVATPFEQRPYGLELSLCQRYYEKVDSNRCNIPVYGTGTGFLGSVKYKVPKRTVPTISLGTASHWRTIVIHTGVALSSLNVQETTVEGFDINGTSSNGNIPAGYAGKIQVNDESRDNGMDGIFVSAEL